MAGFVIEKGNSFHSLNWSNTPKYNYTILQFTVMKSTYISFLRFTYKALPNCPLMVPKMFVVGLREVSVL